MIDEFDNMAEENLYPTVDENPEDFDDSGVEEEDENDGQPDDLTENENFAHDGDMDNMYPTEDGFYTNCEGD